MHLRITMAKHGFRKSPTLIVISILAIVLVSALLNFHKDIIQSFNRDHLLDHGWDGRLVPHRVNSIEKLTALYGHGIRSFEVDLFFRDEDSSGYFEVGHDESKLAGVRLDSFLISVDPTTLKKMWMDVKNVSADVLPAIVHELNRLDSLYGIRDYAIVETQCTQPEVRAISAAGYHLSYYLPTTRLESLLDTASAASLETEAMRLQEIVDSQQVAAVSFDLALYPFVIDYLQPLIPDTVVYHTWGSVKLWEWDAISRLEAEPWFHDQRVKTILYRVWR